MTLLGAAASATEPASDISDPKKSDVLQRWGLIADHLSAHFPKLLQAKKRGNNDKNNKASSMSYG